MSDVKVQRIFERTYNGVTFRDALWFSKADYDLKNEAELVALEDERFNAYVYKQEHPDPIVIPPPPTEDELKQQVIDLQAQIDALTSQTQTVLADIQVMQAQPIGDVILG